jgi:hypothetical protein
VRLHTYRGAACLLLVVAACSNERPPPAARSAETDRVPHQPQIETPSKIESTTPYRAKLATHGAELYLPPWFSPHASGYDLMVHFHGLGRLQEANVERAQLNVAVVSVNLGVGTDQYGNAFRDGAAFERLLAEVDEEIEKSGRGRGVHLRRLALSAWSAGYVSVARVLSTPQMLERVDAVLLADGFFTSFTNIKKRTMNTEPLDRWVHLVEAASQGTKLLAITHTTIPTGDYPSVQEVVAKLLEMSSTAKVATNTVGPRDMKELYAVDRGSFHVKGYEGVLAGDHIKQIKMMGETLYPYLKARWDAEDPRRPAAKK